MRVNVTIALDFDEATISKEEAQKRVELYVSRMLDDESGILTADGAVMDNVEFDVEVA